MTYARFAAAALFVLGTSSLSPARAQWGFPGGFGGFGWEGWGVGTVAGDEARGLGMFAMGAGIYNVKTAVANSIDTETVMRWNEYVHESQLAANRARERRQAARREQNTTRLTENQKRLRENPDPRDITRGDALNAALDDLNSPAVYLKAIQGAKAQVGGAAIRQIPFRYAPAAITFSIHQLASGETASPLKHPDFEADRAAIKELDRQLTEQVDNGNEPDPATVRKLLAAIYAAEDKAKQVLRPNSLERTQADRYLKALHGLVAMLKAPVLDPYLAGVEKRPETTLAELIDFMNAFNLRFGPANTPAQREVYLALHPKLASLRDQVSRAAEKAEVHKATGTEPLDFFGRMSYEDLEKKAPRP